MIQIALVLSTAREGRESAKVAQYLKGILELRDDVQVTYVDVRDHVSRAQTLPPWGAGGALEQPTPWKAIIEQSTAVIFVLPEYNRGYPGEWKLLLDTLYTEYQGKHVYIVGVSSGAYAGVRVAEHIKPVLVEVGFILHKTALFIGKVETAFTPEGTPVDADLAKRSEAFVQKIVEEIGT